MFSNSSVWLVVTTEFKEIYLGTSGAEEQELASPILSLCHGIFTD